VTVNCYATACTVANTASTVACTVACTATGTVGTAACTAGRHKHTQATSSNLLLRPSGLKKGRAGPRELDRPWRDWVDALGV